MKRSQQAQRLGKRQHLNTNTALKTEKKMPYNKSRINLACSRSVYEKIFADENLMDIFSCSDLALGLFIYLIKVI